MHGNQCHNDPINADIAPENIVLLSLILVCEHNNIFYVKIATAISTVVWLLFFFVFRLRNDICNKVQMTPQGSEQKNHPL